MGHLGMAKGEVYRALAERLDKNPVGAVINDTLMKILYILYSDTEAEIGSHFPMLPVTAEKLAGQLSMDQEQLVGHLNNMADKGLVIDTPRKGTVYYMLSPLVIGFFEYTFMRVTDKLPMQELAELFNTYHHAPGVAETFFQAAETKMFQTWAYEDVLPTEVETEVLDYEKASAMIRDSGGGSLTMCYCRHQARHMGTACDAPVEDVCTSLGRASEWLVRRGFARPATMDELLRVLERTQELGLVHLGDNVQKNPAYICHCCGCCCGALGAINKHDVMSVQPSNYIPLVEMEKCAGCGKCQQRCQINAIQLVEQTPGDKKSKRAIIREDRCIGCGVCIAGCKKEAITLVRRKTLYVPPVNKKDQMTKIALESGKIKHYL